MANEPKKTEKKKAENEPQDDWENIAEDIDITEDMDMANWDRDLDLNLDWSDEDLLLDSANYEDPVRLYLKEIGMVDLLSTDDEFRLATCIAAIDFMDRCEAAIGDVSKTGSSKVFIGRFVSNSVKHGRNQRKPLRLIKKSIRCRI